MTDETTTKHDIRAFLEDVYAAYKNHGLGLHCPSGRLVVAKLDSPCEPGRQLFTADDWTLPDQTTQ